MFTPLNSRISYTYFIDHNLYYSFSTWSNFLFKYLNVNVSMYVVNEDWGVKLNLKNDVSKNTCSS